MLTLSDEQFLSVLERYWDEFGSTFSAVSLSPERRIAAYLQMLQCLRRQRGEPVTDASLGLEQGEGVIVKRD